MQPSDYIKNTKTFDQDDDTVNEMIVRCANTARLLHYVLGVSTEAAELQDAVKKHIAYGKKLDIVNMKEELSDVLWYVARICELYDFSFEELMDLNIKKLEKRYGNKFTQEAAINRNVSAERKILED